MQPPVPHPSQPPPPPARSRRRGRVRQRPPLQTTTTAAALLLSALATTAAAAIAPGGPRRVAFAPPPPPPPPSHQHQHHQHQPQHPPLRTLLIDNYDSYTYNLAHYLAEVNGGVAPLVVYNDECGGDWRRLLARHGPFDNVVISPGPGSPERPEDFGLSRFALDEADTPVLGICLGHQGLGMVHGGKVVRAPQPMHGRLSRVSHTGQGVFAGIPQDFAAVRYHSLIVEPPRDGNWELEATAWTSDGLLMGLQHRSRPHFGVQFHPESIGTHHGHALLRNFRDITLARQRAQMQQQENEERRIGAAPSSSSSAPIYIERPRATAAAAAAAAAKTDGEWAGAGAGTHVLIARLGALPGAQGDRRQQPGAGAGQGGGHGGGGGTLSDRVFQALYAGEPTVFWLDSSATAAPYASHPATAAAGGAPGAVPPKNGGRFSYMGAAGSQSGGEMGHVLEYYLSPSPSSSSSSPLLRILKGQGGSVVVEERPGASLFPHLQATLRGIREGGVRMSVVEEGSGGEGALKDVGNPGEELPGLEFWGGYVGYLGYELKEDCLRLQRAGGTDAAPPSATATTTSATGHHHDHDPLPAAPDAVLVFADRVVVFDHVKGTVDLVAVVHQGGEAAGRAWLAATAARVRALAAAGAAGGTEEEEWEEEGQGQQEEEEVELWFAPRVAPEEYKARVDRCLELIAAGETYEVCLTGQLSAPLPHPTDPFRLYRRLRRRNPAPFAAFLRHDPNSRLLPQTPPSATPATNPAPAVAVCCSSPERFLRVARDGRRVESKPIKGTVRRGQTPEEDSALAAGLAACEKNRAENLMIVDLVRNDVARVCRPGSVKVPKLMAVETYATVHQLVSTVAGELAPGKDAVDAIVASFPGGSMTGAPKKRTMEIIARLEEQPRGPYSGALGYIALDGLAADLNIVIRTAVMTPGQVGVGAGGAIVALSERESEYGEMILKARAVAAALGSAPSELGGEEKGQPEPEPVVAAGGGGGSSKAQQPVAPVAAVKAG